VTSIDRRAFLTTGAIASSLGGLRAQAAATPTREAAPHRSGDEDRTIWLSGDGLGLTPAEYSRVLARLSEEKGIAPDSYSLGAIVADLETEFARLLGKERAIFMPTGTLANHLAVRALAGGPGRVLVQHESHLYQDTGDCAQTLSQLTLMPLAPGSATFTAADVERAIEASTQGRVPPRVSVISIETPVRRRFGERFDGAELEKIVALATRNGIKLHLDGARLFLQAVYTGEDVAATARPFDTVYVSLYKYFNAASGAILAGPRALLDGMHHTRRMFGGGLSSVWPFAAIARHYAAGFSDRYRTAVQISEELIRILPQRGSFAVERVPSGTNLFRLRAPAGDPAAFRKRLAAQQIMLAPPRGDVFLIGVNETLNRTSASDLADALVRALQS
jgi:threonine aldolase